MLSITKDIQGTLRFGPLLLETRLTSSTKPKDLPIILFASSVKFLCSHNSNSTGADVSSHYKLDFTVYWVRQCQYPLHDRLIDPFVSFFHTAHPRFLNRHGQHGARLNSHQRVHDTAQQRSLLLWCLKPLLFGAHHSRLSQLEAIWVDMTLCQEPWKLFIDSVVDEWHQSLLGVRVCLTVPPMSD